MPDDLKPVLKLLLEALQSTGNFAMEQAPLVLREMIWWGTGEAIFWWALWWTAAAVVYFWIRPTVYYAVDADDQDRAIGDIFFRVGCSIAMLAAAGVNAFTLIKISVAPRLYLIEQIGQILNGK